MRARMTAIFALFVGALMLLGGAAMMRRETRRAEWRTREILTLARERATDELREAPEKTLLQAVVADQNELSEGGLVLVVADGQKVLWHSRENFPHWPAVGDDWRFGTLSQNGQTLILARDWEPIEEELADTREALWGLGFLMVAATALGAWFVVGKTLSPLEKLAAQAQNASTKSRQVRLQSPSSDAEMRHLTETLNALLARLENESLARGRFYAAASHELRTPIQALLGQIDVARSRPRSLAEYESTLEEIQTQTERLANLTQDLLQLNALEMRQNAAPAEEINLRFWVERALEQQSAAMQARELKVEIELEDAPIVAPPAHVEMLLRNLLENAVKYATPQTTLEIGLANLQDGAQLSVWNACEVADNTDLSLWFEPFFRPDASRNSQNGGNGLGLSIVAALARANDWHVELKAENGGVKALVWWPTALQN